MTKKKQIIIIVSVFLICSVILIETQTNVGKMEICKLTKGKYCFDITKGKYNFYIRDELCRSTDRKHCYPSKPAAIKETGTYRNSSGEEVN